MLSHLPRVGLRVGKTILCVAAILFVYALLQRNACFACIGAVVGMGTTVAHGKITGGNRVIGTLVGGLLAVPFYWLYTKAPFGVPGWMYLLPGLFLLLYLCQLLHVTDSIQPGSVMFFVVVFTVPANHLLPYVAARIADTFIGVAAALALNYIWPAKQVASESSNAEAPSADADASSIAGRAE